jgi:hypothetical protein
MRGQAASIGVKENSVTSEKFAQIVLALAPVLVGEGVLSGRQAADTATAIDLILHPPPPPPPAVAAANTGSGEAAGAGAMERPGDRGHAPRRCGL